LPDKNIQKEKIFSSDREFNQLYPSAIRVLAQNHWTPLEVARKAADFLAAEKKAKILDIGSGVGKFCLAAAYYKPHAFFYGIEQRKSLIDYAEKIKTQLQLNNVLFIAGNFTKINFKDYNHFYFYNSFYENEEGTQKIDNSVEYSSELFAYYNHYLFKQLEKMPEGTRLATYHILEEEMPEGYHVVGADLENLLKFWEKI
jgi:SAM-dependent methyltransferase